ncbi:MAG: class I fructose-bisphosphate aldolase [Solirubrobacteraceae bacterium]
MTEEEKNELRDVAKAMVARGKGILAADESTGTMSKRLEAVDIEATDDTRRGFREVMFTTEGTEEYISGVIMYDTTIRESTMDGTPFPEQLSEKGILPGIKVDTGAKPLAGSEDEKVTEGLDGLRERLEEYSELGAKFAKWRGVIEIDEEKGLPTDYCIHANAHALGRYAALCQEAGIVPIVEPEVLMDGTHTIEQAYEVTKRTLHAVFDELYKQQVFLEGIVLKPNMVLTGYENDDTAEDEEVARLTIQCLRETVPGAVPGIAFLSGGQDDQAATERLNALNQAGDQPWELSFSYGRGLQATPLEKWAGEDENIEEAQTIHRHRAKCNAAAREGEYTAEMEKELAPA